jgi:acetolactate synthase regulatory subunit
MANFRPYVTKDGRSRVLAVVRIKGAPAQRMAFGSMADAKRWAAGLEKLLRQQRDRAKLACVLARMRDAMHDEP